VDSINFFDTCARIGRSRAPDPPGNARGVDELLANMARLNIAGAAVEHAVAMESSPRLGHELLARELGRDGRLRPAWHLMPDIHPRIARAVTDPAEVLAGRVALGRVDAKDFCNGQGDRACFAPVLEACSAVRLPVFLDFRRQGDVMTFDFAICERWPRIPFVIEGFGGYPLHRVVWCLREYPNLHLSTVGFSAFRGVALMHDLVGPRRIVFGSNWPAEQASLAMGIVLLASIPQEARHLIARGNFEQLLARIGGGKGTHEPDA
jgi:predicted TIM-barrel fold metal-dependent hydrolase